ncbi:MAG: tetratricopeptide repeat protein [Hyphomicrobiaceae bacterium]|nr:MAG: tetratricopeptide repeat protein [Hyphomicrobiaceae bacterium]
MIMSLPRQPWVLAFLGIFACLVGLVPSQAQDEAKSRRDKLDQLFSSLQAEKLESNADIIVLEIWRLWGQSGRGDVDRLLAEATDHMRSGANERALAVLDRIVELAPDFAEGWNKRATVLYLLDEHDRSLADIAKVLELEPRHFGAIAGSGLIAIARGDWKTALAAYRRALAINPFLKERLELIPALEEKVKGSPI